MDSQSFGEARVASSADFDALVRVDHVAAGGDTERRQSLWRAVSAGECLLVDDAAGVAGFAVVRPADFFGRDFIELIVVDPTRRRTGIGRQLLRACVAAATSADVFTSTNRSNAPMLALLDHDGWLFSGELCGLDHGDPELVFFLRRA